MNHTEIRKKLHEYIDKIEDKKAEAIYTLLVSEIDEQGVEYTQEFKDELDRRYQYYQDGGEMVTAEEAIKQVESIVKII